MGDTILGLSITIQSKVDNAKIDDTLENYLESVDVSITIKIIR